MHDARAAEAEIADEDEASLLRDRLDFTLPDFTRLAWVSDRARAVWEPRLQRITAAWQEIEWQSVVRGIRRCAVTIVNPVDFLEQGARWARHGLNALPLELLGSTGQPYSATAVEHTPGDPFVYRFVLGTPANVVDFSQAWDASDQETIGSLLGYPACCREFFRRVWVDWQMVDTTWPMAAATSAPSQSDAARVVATGRPHANILWRWMGLRAVPHLPCRFDCEATVEIGSRLVELGRDLGHRDEMDDLERVLSWPVEWSSLHGVAEIKTPVVKVATRTDATGSKHVVQLTGEGYPDEGAHGLDFPYRRPGTVPFTQSKSYQRGLNGIISLPILEPTSQDAKDNGFADQASMDAAHAPIIKLAIEVLSDHAGDVLDLGCGNGALLEKIARACPRVIPVGVELDPERVARARALHSGVASNMLTQDMFDVESIWENGRRFRLALLMPGRLLEADVDRASRLVERLRRSCDRVLVYAYGDWLKRYGDIETLARTAGLNVESTRPGATVALVAW